MVRPRNNIGLLRLIFATFVIIGHAPELIDGNRGREPLTNLLHTVSLGELSVDAFFLLSGYLITKSMLESFSVKEFVVRRVARIIPAFFVAYIISVFVLGPIVGARPWNYVLETLKKLAFLQSPMLYPGQLRGLHYPDLNGALWTISYEFRCYLLVSILYMLGILYRKYVVLSLSSVIFAASFIFLYRAVDRNGNYHSISNWMDGRWHHGVDILTGNPVDNSRLLPIFLVGVCFYLFRESIMPRLNGYLVSIFAIITIMIMYNDENFSQLALTTFGACVLFWVALKMNMGMLGSINDKWDISYGVYLYGWPISTFIIWRFHVSTPWILAVLTLPIAFVFGAGSWFLVERRARDWARTVTRRMRPDS